MMQTRKMLVGTLAGLVIGTGSARTDTPDAAPNPYQAISERNVFHLNPPPPPPAPPETKAPTPKIFLTGITTLGGSKRALLKTLPQGKPGEAPKERSYMLTEGERQDDLEVLSIDERGGIVRVTYAGDSVSVNFKDNAVASTTPAAPGPGGPGAPGAPANRNIPPGALLPGFHPGAPPAVPGAAGMPAPNPFANAAAPSPTMGAGGMGMAPAPAAPPITAEQQAVLIEMNREIQKTVDPEAPPFPPTLLSEQLDAANQEATAAAAGNGGTTPTRPGVTPNPLPIPGRPGFPGLPGSF